MPHIPKVTTWGRKSGGEGRAAWYQEILPLVRVSMNSAWLSGYPLGALAAPWLASRETTALILAVISFLFFRAFRERYLLTWGMGWIAYGVFLYLERRGVVHAPSPALVAITSAEFV